MFTYNCEVTYIVDGDTCDVKIDLGFDVFYKTRVRLYGINTPESRTREKDTRIVSHDKGKYGRVLGEILVKRGEDWTNVNKQLVKEGHAVEYYGGKR